MADLYPLLLEPALHAKVWGGRRLATAMHKMLPDEQPYGEAWEMHDTATVARGPLAGRTLADLTATYGHDLIGVGNDPAEGLPLLAKLIDASDWLSIQVHPNDEQARELEGDPRGKTEAWIILAAEPGARLVIGVQPGTSRAALAEAIRDNRLEDLIVYADVQPMDVLYVRANTVHAIGPGILLYEIQQASNVTYRLYDWGRMGMDGKPRALHIDKGVRVANVASLPEITHAAQGDAVSLVRGDYFQTTLHRLQDAPVALTTGGVFHALTCIEGSATVTQGGQALAFGTGQTVLVPAALGDYTLTGRGAVLRSSQTTATGRMDDGSNSH